MSQIPQALLVGGRLATRDLAAEHTTRRSADPWVNHSSLALSVHPADAKAFQKDADDRGLRVNFRADGLPEFRSHNEQRKYCRAYGFVNFSDYY